MKQEKEQKRVAKALAKAEKAEKAEALKQEKEQNKVAKAEKAEALKQENEQKKVAKMKNGMNGLELFERIKQSTTFYDLLQSFPTQSAKGNVFEKVCDIIIKFGFCPIFPNDTYDHYIGNANKGELKKVDNLEVYLRRMSVFGKGKGGASDITLQNKNNEKWIFVSSKFYLDDSAKSINDYDVANLLGVAKDNSHKYTNFGIYLNVNNKKKLLDTIRSSHETNKYIKNNIKHISDLKDFALYFQNLKLAIQDIGFDEINTKFCNSKVPLEERFHQELITNQTMKRIKEGEQNILFGAKPRSGKTYCVGGLFIKYHKKYESLNGLIITPAPTETISQFTDDLFHTFRDFNGINIVEIKKGADFKKMELEENNIIIVSKQLLDDYVFENKVEAIQQVGLDFIVFDENHFHGTTQMSKHIIQTYSSPNTIKLYLTATYAKPLSAWNIPLNCQFYWDIEDEQMCKTRNIEGLKEKHGEEVLLLLNEENTETKLRVYDEMPDLHIITNMMDKKRFDAIKDKIQDTSYGFSNGTLLSGKFEKEVKTILGYITGSNKEQDYPKKDLSIFKRINDIAIEKNSRTRFNNVHFTTQLWFLPFGINMSIAKVSEDLKKIMEQNSILKTYEIKIVNSKNNYKVNNLKEKIKNWELEAKKDGKDGMILLAGNQLSLGITLPFVDVVFLFNDIVSSDKIIQMMYRCMTERMKSSENDKINNKSKKMGFVVDLNISRVLNTCLDYNVYKKDLNVEQKISYLVENNLINIDSDLFQGRENKTKLVEKLLNIWKGDPINNLKRLLRKIEDEIIDMEPIHQRMMNMCFAKSVGDDKVNWKVKFDDENKEPLPTGKEITKQNDTTDDETSTEDSDETNTEVKISFTKDVLPFVIPLICILTINTNDNDIVDMLNYIKDSTDLLSVFKDQSFIWWNKQDIKLLIENLVVLIGKYIKKDSCIYNTSIQFKMSLQSLIDKPLELLELIDSCLKPKLKEKQENGEVFTPMRFVFQMLDHLDNHYIKEHGRSIFTEAKFKWFDPASGMGNFPVGVYLKLMEGLKTQMPNDEERKKHIIENMLYMSELNKKNVFISRQIFDINNEYNLNIDEGDTLELDTGRVWGIQQKSFDVVLGNPPYNKGGIRSHTGKQLGEKNETIWTTFIEKSFDEWLKPDGFLAFINPLSWLKKSHSLHNKMLEKHVVWLQLWDNSQSKGMINADIPISLFVLQNKKNTTHKTTEITSILKRRSLTTTSNEYLNPNYSIPLAFHSIFNKLIGFIETRNLQLEYNTKTIKSSGTKEKIPTEYTVEDMWAVDTYTLKEGLMVKKTTEQHPDAIKRKLIISNKTSFMGAFIDEGKLGLTGTDKFYILGENLELILKMLKFDIANMLGDYTKYRMAFLEKEVCTYIPDLRKLGIQDIAEDEFYNLIGLTRQEIDQIKNS